MSRLWAEPAGLSYKEQVGSSSLTSSHYQHSSWSERGKKKTPGMGVKPISKTFKIPVSPPRSLSQSLAVIILFALSLLPSEERRGEKVGGMVYLTLICPVVSFREMTCNLGGKGQLFLFSSSESQFTAPGDFFLKLQTISGSATMFLIHSAGRG